MKKVYGQRKFTPKQRAAMRMNALAIAQEVLPRTQNAKLVQLCRTVIDLFSPTDRASYMRHYMATYRKGRAKKKTAPAARARSPQRSQPEPKGADKGSQGEKSDQIAGFTPRRLEF